MELNKIYRYFGIPKDDLYTHMKEKFTEAFAGFEGVSFEEPITGNEYKIYLNAEKTVYIQITVDIIKFSVNDVLEEIPKIGSAVSYRQYNIVRTAYGVAFSNIGTTNDANEILTEDRFFTSFFVVGNPNVFIHTRSQFLPANNNEYALDFICSDFHEAIEQQNMITAMKDNTVRTKLFNAGSLTYPVDCEHLYRFAFSDGKIGKIKVGEKYFVSGTRYALEYNPNDDGKEV